MNGLLLVPGLLLDRCLGEPARYHPLVGFGTLAQRVERILHRHPESGAAGQFCAGTAAWCLLVLPPVLLLAGLQLLLPDWADLVLGAIVLYASLGLRSLVEHARAVAAALDTGSLELARQRVGYMVSRDSAELQPPAILRATLESVLENGADAVIAPLFWCLLAGAPGVLLHRLANTLDAQWGYKSPRYRYFGRTAARADDLLNWFPARLCALLYGCCGQFRDGWRCYRRQGPQSSSPNAGRVMAAGAGALGMRLGGPAHYRGQLQSRPHLGCGEPPAFTCADNAVQRALQLVTRAAWTLATASALAGLAICLGGAR